MAAFLRGQRKSELVELAETVGLKNASSMKKGDLESSLDEYLGENASQFVSDPKLALKLAPYYNSRAKATGSPVKKEPSEAKSAPKRRQTKAAQDEIVVDKSSSDLDEPPVAQSTALARTPARALSLASRIPLPATPADVAQAVDRGTLAVRQRVASLYAESGVVEATQTARESLSTVNSVLLLVSAFELWYLRAEVLADRYAFTIPAVPLLRTPDYPVHLPDMFLLLSASFWSPVLTWTLTSAVVPSLVGYFINLSAANSSSNHSAGGGGGRGRAATRAASQDYVVDPLTFSVVKALLTYVVYAQGVTFGGWVDPLSVARINSAVYGGWQGVLVGCAVTGLTAVYDAVLRK